jgi:hypothetical protein
MFIKIIGAMMQLILAADPVASSIHQAIAMESH